MSAENVELIKAMYAAFFRRDVAFVVSKLSPDVVVRQAAALPWGGEYRGAEGFTAFLGKLAANLDNRALPVERYLDAGEEVVAIGRTQGFVRATGKAFDVPLAHVWRVREGKVVAFTPFIDIPAMMPALTA